MEIKTTWTDVKSLASAKTLSLQYSEEPSSYYVFIQEGIIIYTTVIRKESPASSDQTDFEANYKSSSNTGIQASPVSGSFSFSESRYAPRLAQNTSDISLSYTDTTLINITGDGKVDFLNFRFSKKNVNLGIFVDGVEQYRVILSDMKGQHKLDDGVEDGNLVGVDDGEKMYKEVFLHPADFTTSFEVKAKKTGSSPKFLAGIVKHRIKI